MAYITKKTTVDGIKPIGSNLYGTCSTASGTATKTVSMPDFNVLVEGVTIHVYFENDNTADNATLKVGSTEAKPIRYNGQAGGSWEAGGFISFTYYNGSWIQNDITIAGVTYTFSISGHTMTINGSDGSVQTITLPDNDTTYTLSKSGSTVTLTGSDGSTSSVTDADTKYGLQLQNGKLKLVEGGTSSEITLPDDDTTYTLSISGHTLILTPSSGTAQSVTLPDDNTDTNVTQTNTTANADYRVLFSRNANDTTETTTTRKNTGFRYNPSTQLLKVNGMASVNGRYPIINCDVTTAEVRAVSGLDTSGTNCEYMHDLLIAICQKYPNLQNHRFQGVLQPNSFCFYDIFIYDTSEIDTTTGLPRYSFGLFYKYGSAFVKFGTSSYTYSCENVDNDTTYTAGDGLQLSGTEFSVKTGYTTSGNNRKVQTDSNGNLYVVQKDSNTTYTAGTGLDLDGTEFNHSNAVTAVTTESLRKIKYDAQGHITGSSAVVKADITALGIPSSDTNNRRGFYGTCTTAAATAAKVVTLGSTAGWELVAGTIVGVKFSYTNTADNPTLNVNSSGAKSIIYNTGTITTSNLNKAGYASRITYYMYDGSHWVWMGWSIDDNTWQSNTNARAGYVASGANQINKVWKTDEDGNPAWREEIKYPIRIVTGTSGATTSLSNMVITKVPLTVTGTNLSGNVGSTLTLNSTTRAIRIIGEGLYRITASVYIRPAANAMIGAYIMVGTDSTAFSDAVEGASSLSYATTTGGAVNITQTLDVPANSTVYVYLCARTFGTTGTAFNDNQATFLEVEQVR